MIRRDNILRESASCVPDTILNPLHILVKSLQHPHEVDSVIASFYKGDAGGHGEVQRFAQGCRACAAGPGAVRAAAPWSPRLAVMGSSQRPFLALRYRPREDTTVGATDHQHQASGSLTQTDAPDLPSNNLIR